jgi:hypothetical protein
VVTHIAVDMPECCLIEYEKDLDCSSILVTGFHDQVKADPTALLK